MGTGSFALVDYLLLPLLGTFILAFSKAGMSGTARIPLVGPELAEILGPGWRHIFAKVLSACGLHSVAAWCSRALGFAIEESSPKKPSEVGGLEPLPNV